MFVGLLLAPVLLLTVPFQAGEPPSAGQLVEQARAFVPVFEADRTEFLTAEQRRKVLASTSLLDASLALEPEQALALWWKGHVETLLGADGAICVDVNGSVYTIAEDEWSLVRFDPGLSLL